MDGDRDQHERADRRGQVEPADPAAQREEQHRHAGNVGERDRKGDPPHADPVEDRVENDVQREVRERDERRDPRGLQAEEAAIQHQHHPVEGEPDREGGERARDDVRLVGLERAALVEQPDDRLGENDRDHRGGDQEEVDLADAAGDRVAETVQVTAGREPRERREEHRCDRDREHPLRQHVDAEGLVDRARSDRRVDPRGRDERPDHRVDVDQPEAEHDRAHQLEDLLDHRISEVDRHPQPVVAAAQPRERQEQLEHRAEDDRARVDVELRALRVGLGHADHEPGDDRQVPDDRRQGGDRELVVAVQDSGHDPGQAEQHDDREEDLRQRHRQVVVGVREQWHEHRGGEDEERGQPAADQQEEPEDGRRDAPGPRPLPLFQQLAEDGHERGRQRRVGDDGPDEVRDLECDREGVDRAARAEVVRRDDLADEPEQAREPGGGREDRRRPREPACVGSRFHASEYRNRGLLPLLRSCAPAAVRALFSNAEHQTTGKARPVRCRVSATRTFATARPSRR